MQYLALAKGLASRELVPLDYEFQKTIKKNSKQDYYISLYRYEDHHLKKFQEDPTLKGITDVKTSKLIFDFDNGVDISEARKDTLEVCARLVNFGIREENIRIYFSGNKGFHVDVSIKDQLTRQEFVNIVFGLAGDLSTFDTTINDEQRIIRAPLSFHPKSKLYKIPLTLAELSSKSIDQIKQDAKDPSHYDFDEIYEDALFEVELPEGLSILKKQEYKKITKTSPLEVINDFNVEDINFSQCPKWMTKERYALQEGFFYGSDTLGKGERNSAFMIMGATYKNQGFSADHTLNLLLTMADKQAKRTKEAPWTEEKLKAEVISVVFSPGWKGGIYGRDEELLRATRDRFKITDIIEKPGLVKIADVAARFKAFAKAFDQNRIMTGIDSIDNNVIITTGMMVGLLGTPGSGKTTMSNTFIEHVSKEEPVIYESLDMYDNLLFIRLIQKYAGYDMKKIIDMFKEDSPDETLLNAYGEVIKNYSNVEFNFRSGLTVEEIEQDVIDYKSYTGKQPKLLVVDYLEKVRGPFSDATANSAYVASRLSDIAKKHDLCVVLILQPQKSAGTPQDPLLSMRQVKGSSVVEQDCRIILTLWRPGFNPQDSSDDNFVSMAIVKNNMGGLTQIDLGWNGLQGTFYELDSEQRLELKHLNERIAQIKAHRDDI